METLEHLEFPETALQEISRVLKEDGVFICTVPTDIYERKCSELYGPNPYHVQAFSQQNFADLLSSKFKFVSLAVASQRLVTTIQGINASLELEASLLDESEADRLDGSYVAICSNQELFSISPALYTGMSRIEYDKEAISPLRSSLNNAEELASARWDLILKTEKINQGYKETIESYKKEVEACRALIKDTESLAQKRLDMLIEAETKVSARYSKIPLVKFFLNIAEKFFDRKNTRK
ncbi:SAM-dependent methyltransferase [Pseudomonas psychrotolerans]|nr:SAM-dependent methyltransferase [Pseudomonas psychrotolerans]